MKIITETHDLIIAVKPPELISERTENRSGFADLLAERNNGYIGVIHRLDKGVGGLMIYAKTPNAAKLLSQAAQEHRLGKEYVAVTEGIPPQPEGTLTDLLYYDRGRNKVFPVTRARKGVKEAVLKYRTLGTASHPETGAPLALVSVQPVTGRTHQIRVQFASRGLPLLGDRKYGGSGNTGISLWCRAVALPGTGTQPGQTYTLSPSGIPWDWFGNELQ